MENEKVCKGLLLFQKAIKAFMPQEIVDEMKKYGFIQPDGRKINGLDLYRLTDEGLKARDELKLD